MTRQQFWDLIESVAREKKFQEKSLARWRQIVEGPGFNYCNPFGHPWKRAAEILGFESTHSNWKDFLARIYSN